MDIKDKEFLLKAIEKAKESVAQGGFPAGAIVVKNGQVVGSGVSIGNLINDPTSHGEMASIRDACKNLKNSNLSDTILYASMQPCLMCLSASMWASIPRIVFACSKEKVSDEYYGGNYQIFDVNKEFLHPIDFVYVPELEDVSLAIVKEWEKAHK